MREDITVDRPLGNLPGQMPKGFDRAAVSSFAPFRRLFEAPLSPDELESIAATLSNGVSGAIAAETAGLLHRFSVLLEITRIAGGTPSLDELLPRLIDLVTDVLGADRATLFVHDADSNELFSRVAHGGAVTEIRIPSDAGIAGMVFRSGESVVIADAYADPRFNREVDRRTSYRTRDILCVPVVNKDGATIGVTQLLNKRDGGFTDEDRLLLQAMATQASAALENARLVERLEKARRDEAVLLEVTSAMASELDLDTLLVKIMTAARALLDAERSTLFIHDAETDELWSRFAEGVTSREIRFPSRHGIAGEAFHGGATLNIADAYADSRFNPAVDRDSGFRTRNILCMPMRNKIGQTIAVMQVLNKVGGPFTAQDETRLRNFSAQAAIALENAALFNEVLQLRNYNEGILKSLSDGVVTLDADLRILKLNDAAVRILGAGGDAVVNRDAREVFVAPNDWVVNSLDFVARTGGTDYHADRDFRGQGNRTISVNVTVNPLIDVDSVPIGYLIVIEDITSEKRLRTTMARYLAKEIVDKVLESGDDPFIVSDQEVTVLFSDIRRFTTITEGLGARGAVSMLNDYFTEMVEVVLRNEGLLDKYIGDSIMAVFGAPLTGLRDADNALTAAVEMTRALRSFNAGRVRDGREALEIGIGIATGQVIAGSVGSVKRMDYTVIGDSVNLAARLESANKYYGTSVLISESTVAQLRAPEDLREIDLLRVKGKTRPIAVYEPLACHRPELREKYLAALALFEAGRRLFLEREWRAAAAKFEDFLARCPGDVVARLYIDRCTYFADRDPGPDWDGAWTLSHK
jgi:adenylate cyclase